MNSGPPPLAERVHGQPGLRERKKLKAMRHIQEVALDLFDEHGYGAVTIERIAAEAEVSPSSIYRYFGTKEQLVLYDEYDPVALKQLDDELAVHDPVESLRHTLAGSVRMVMPDDMELIRRRMSYIFGEPAVRAGLSAQLEELDAVMREILARRTGRDIDDLDVKVVTSSLLGGFLAALEYWHETDYRESMETLIDRTLAVLSGGLKLE